MKSKKIIPKKLHALLGALTIFIGASSMCLTSCAPIKDNSVNNSVSNDVENSNDSDSIEDTNNPSTNIPDQGNDSTDNGNTSNPSTDEGNTDEGNNDESNNNNPDSPSTPSVDYNVGDDIPGSVKDIDYEIIDGVKWTLPSTSNINVINTYGTTPLPWIKDSEITKEQLITMQTKIVQGLYTEVSFGKRDINSNRVNSAFVQWVLTEWVNYPYFSFQSNSMCATIKNPNNIYLDNTKEIMEKDWYIEKLVYKGCYCDKYFYYGYYRDSLNEILKEVNELIRPGMNVLDKVLALYIYVINLFSYERPSPSFEDLVYTKQGVCKDYASIYAFLLNMYGVKAISRRTGQGAEGRTHQIVWLYLPVNENNQLDPNGNKYLWFDSDITCEGFGGKDNCEPKSSFSIKLTSTITSPTKSMYEFNSNDYNRYTYNKYLSVPWTDPFLVDNNVYMSDSYLEPAKSTMLYLTEENDKFPLNIKAASFGKPLYYNGEWYRLVTGAEKDKYGESVPIETVICKQKFEDKDATILNASDLGISEEQMTKISNAAYYYKNKGYGIQSFQYKDYFIFLGKSTRNSSGQYSFIVVDMNTKKVQEIQISSQLTNSYISNYYVKDGVIYYKWADNTKYDTLENNSNVFDNIVYTKTDVDTHVRYAKTFINTFYPNYNGENDLTIEEKQNALNEIEFYSKIKQNLDSNEYKEIINKIDSIITKVENESIPLVKNLTWTNKVNDVYYCNRTNYDKYGFKLSIFDAIEKPIDILIGNHYLVYELYYSKDGNSNFEMIKQNVNRIHEFTLDKSILQNPDGYFYVKIYPVNNKEESIQSKTFQIKIIDDDSNITTTSGTSILFNNLKTNYNTTSNWYEKDIKLLLSGNYNYISYNVDYKLHYLNLDTKKDEVVASGNITSNSIPYYTVGQASSLNHGVYYLEINERDKTTSEIIQTSYGNYFYLYTKDDIDHYDQTKWKTLIDSIDK